VRRLWLDPSTNWLNPGLLNSNSQFSRSRSTWVCRHLTKQEKQVCFEKHSSLPSSTLALDLSLLLQSTPSFDLKSFWAIWNEKVEFLSDVITYSLLPSPLLRPINCSSRISGLRLILEYWPRSGENYCLGKSGWKKSDHNSICVLWYHYWFSESCEKYFSHFSWQKIMCVWLLKKCVTCFLPIFLLKNVLMKNWQRRLNKPSFDIAQIFSSYRCPQGLSRRLHCHALLNQQQSWKFFGLILVLYVRIRALFFSFCPVPVEGTNSIKLLIVHK
jgi:hypothetical protein